jgi:hypothetical protein
MGGEATEGTTWELWTHPTLRDPTKAETLQAETKPIKTHLVGQPIRLA